MHVNKVMVISLITCLLLAGCKLEKTEGEKYMKDSENKIIDEVKSNHDKLATKEFLMETFKLTEKEISDYQVEDYIANFNLTENYFLEEKSYINDFSKIIEDLKKLQDNTMNDTDTEDYDFSYLVKADKYIGDYPDIESIKYLAVSQQYGDGGKSILIDFEKNTKYYSSLSNHIYDNIQNAEEKIEITEKDKKDIIQAVNDAKIWEWDYLYTSDNKDALESWWHFGIEYENGTIISNSGEGKVPENYISLEDKLFKH